MVHEMIRTAAVLAAAGALLAGCALRPAGERQERLAAENAGRAWARESVELSPLPEQPTIEDYLQRAFLANAALQNRYWQWRAALEQVPQDASWPRVALPFNVMFTKENMKLWDRTTLGVTNDPMTNIPWPTKLSTAGRRALEEARAAGRRFEEAKFLLQGRVLATWYELALLAETNRIHKDHIAILRMIVSEVRARATTGRATPQDLLNAQTDLDLMENEDQTVCARIAPTVARFNALLGRAATDPVPLPEALPAARPLPAPDEEVIRLGAERSPALAALAREVAGRREALDLARQAYLPDFSLSASVTGTVAQNLGGMVVLPTRLAAIRAGVEQARANEKAAAAARLQYQRDLDAAFILNLYLLRNDERQLDLFEKVLLPRAREAVKLTQSAYAANRAGFTELLDAQRALLSVQLTAAQLRTEREKALAAIETWSLVDVETLSPAEGRPAR